jgi:hypothetical protein
MKKFTLLAAVLGLALSAQAQTKTTTTTTTTTVAATQPLPLGLNAIGYDQNLNHITARLGLSQNNALDLGFGLNFNSAAPAGEEEFRVGVSAIYLLKLQDWGMVDNYLAAGGWFTMLPNGDPNLTLFGGLQPEITFLDRFIFSVRFGLQATVLQDFEMVTVGSPVSLVEGINFKVIW